MPYLAVDTTHDTSPSECRACTSALTEIYTDEMMTTASHVAVVIREHPRGAMSLGRAVDGPIVVLDADIRRGRSLERRRTFALAVIDWLDRNGTSHNQILKSLSQNTMETS